MMSSILPLPGTSPLFKQAILIDDEPVSNFIARHWLEKYALAETIVEFQSSSQALEWLSQQPIGASPDLILIDLHMPEQDGFELMKEIFERPMDWGERVYVFVLTSSIYAGDLAQAENFPLAGYLIKPLNEDTLQQIIQLVNSGNASE